MIADICILDADPKNQSHQKDKQSMLDQALPIVFNE